ncbi:hypothetical protein Ahy_A04g020445 [Arachis hypogaea]|uniref:PB1-like domain-containing protein n=1 Tax=Arachis hypogaea TaxID=3818 RepID=A0A445DHW3_ARAHY|nr:hypothetical protein Ahy_A04g020445 [Arachis hypogaea]
MALSQDFVSGVKNIATKSSLAQVLFRRSSPSDNKACLSDLHIDTLDVFYLRNYHKKFGYNEIKQCWWHVFGKGLENGLRNLNNDKKIRDNDGAKDNDGAINAYFSPNEIFTLMSHQTEEEFSKTQPSLLKIKVASNTQVIQPPLVSNTQIQARSIQPKSTRSIQPIKPIKTTQYTTAEDTLSKPSLDEDNTSDSDTVDNDVNNESIDYGLDPGANLNSTNSWHSEEMKSPLNLEDELEDDNDSDDACPMFSKGARFGDCILRLDFREAIQKYTIQEGSMRCRTICKVKECPWVVYASRDYKDTYWQIKTFNDDHTCPREDRNRHANRNWVYSKLVSSDTVKLQLISGHGLIEAVQNVMHGMYHHFYV